MRRAVLFLLALVWSGTAGAAGRVVSGKVVIEGNVPLPHATVVLFIGGEQRQGVTGEDGGFRFDDVPAGPASVLAIFGGARKQVSVEDDRPITLDLDLGPEVIGIREHAPPATLPELVDSSVPRRWPYSDELTLRNGWAVVWLRVSIDERGAVTDAVVLKSPPELKLDDIAIASVKRIRYTPARDKHGRAIATSTIVILEWPPYWGGGAYPPCKGSGPLNLDRENPQYRDCEPPPGMPKDQRLTEIRQPTRFGSRGQQPRIQRKGD
jgi:TonB family protein